MHSTQYRMGVILLCGWLSAFRSLPAFERGKVRSRPGEWDICPSLSVCNSTLESPRGSSKSSGCASNSNR